MYLKNYGIAHSRELYSTNAMGSINLYDTAFAERLLTKHYSERSGILRKNFLKFWLMVISF